MADTKDLHRAGSSPGNGFDNTAGEDALAMLRDQVVPLLRRAHEDRQQLRASVDELRDLYHNRLVRLERRLGQLVDTTDKVLRKLGAMGAALDALRPGRAS